MITGSSPILGSWSLYLYITVVKIISVNNTSLINLLLNTKHAQFTKSVIVTYTLATSTH